MTVPPLAIQALVTGDRNRRSRSEFETTETELKAMAAPARTGLMRTPANGKKT
jgi:hypothetical protein